MVKIYKYKIGPNKKSEIKGRFAGVFKVDWQDDELCAWCLVSEQLKEAIIKFYIIPTGYEFELGERWHYVDTIQDGPYVWHIFYEFWTDSGRKGEN